MYHQLNYIINNNVATKFSIIIKTNLNKILCFSSVEMGDGFITHKMLRFTYSIEFIYVYKLF